jgi:hypothetical protein
MIMIIFSGGTDGELQEHLEVMEKSIIESMQQPNEGYNDEITLDERFKNFKLITTYPRQYIFVEKNFALENEELINELIENSAPLQRVC